MMKIEGVEIQILAGNIPEEEVKNYLLYIRGSNPGKRLKSLELRPDGDEIELRYTFMPARFERIRRITGYLAGSTERWNNAKQAEERDRVKHCC